MALVVYTVLRRAVWWYVASVFAYYWVVVLSLEEYMPFARCVPWVVVGDVVASAVLS